MGQATSPWWVELLKALPSIVTAGTAIFGVLLAKAGLEKWRRETIGKRKIEVAEEVLADFYQARDIINEARAAMIGFLHPLVDKGEGPVTFWRAKDYIMK